MKRSICVVTGTRAEYGLLKPVMTAIKKKPELRLQLIVTGMHLIPEFGYTIREIELDGFDIDAKVEMMVANDTLSAMAKSVGLGIIGITQALEQLKPDILLVLGDRIEPLAAVIAASIMNIPIAHISGGKSTGGIDNSIRHAIRDFANIHFATTPLRAKRLQKMGEEAWRIHTVGNLFLDTIKNTELIPASKISEKYSLDLNQPILLVVFHSDTLNIEKSLLQVKNLCESLVKLNMQTVFIYPNADAGGRKIIETIKEYSIHPKIQVHKNVQQVEYFSLMAISHLMLGNSSSGFVEAPAFGLPVINIGDRQKGNDRLDNIVDVVGETDQILNAVKRILTNNDYRNTLGNRVEMYGDGTAGIKIVEILSKIEISDKLRYKNKR